jgi:DNA-binding transcriptional MerR regulator
MANHKRMTITDVAQKLGVTPKTIARWEKAGKVPRPKRDWRGWRTYEQEDFKKIELFKETIIIEAEEQNANSEFAQQSA